MIELIEVLAILGILSMGYFIGRIIEAWLIGSWNYPKKYRQDVESLLVNNLIKYEEKAK